MIQEGRVHRSLSWGGLAAIVGIGALLLPVTLAAAQPQDPPTADPTSVVDSSSAGTVGADTNAGATSQEGSSPPGTDAPPSGDPKLRQELRRARAEVQQLAAQLATAQARLAKLEATVSGSYGSSQTVGVDPTTGRAGGRALQGGGAANNYARPMTAPGNPTATTSESAWGSGGYGSSSADAYSRATRGYADAADFRLRSNRTSSSAAGQPTQRAVADQVNVTALLKAVQDLQATVSQLQRDVQALRQGGTERQGAIEPLPRP